MTCEEPLGNYPYLGAFESTKIHGTSEDILGTTRHIERWEHDLHLLHDCEIRQLRYSVPWHRIEARSGRWDWDWIDGPMLFMKQYGMNPIVDPLHHTSFPDWLTGGFANPEFPQLYVRFLEKFSARYPWVELYTIFNEPLPTVLFCSYTGMWYPYQSSDAAFVNMAGNVANAICMASAMLIRRNSGVKLVHIDTGEHHVALDRRSEKWVNFANHRRFLFHDLVMGRIRRDHPLWPYLKLNGLAPDTQQRFVDEPARIDVLGLDYYAHSEIDWRWSSEKLRPDISFPVKRPLGFAKIGREYSERFHLPILLSETNIRGAVSDRLTWLKFMVEQCEQLVSDKVDFRGFCWYPSIDSTDWCHCCTKCTRSVDPQGIWCLDAKRWRRYSSELSHWYARLSQGTAGSRDLPAYHFLSPLDRDLQGYMRLMKHWPKWTRAAGTTEAA